MENARQMNKMHVVVLFDWGIGGKRRRCQLNSGGKLESKCRWSVIQNLDVQLRRLKLIQWTTDNLWRV